MSRLWPLLVSALLLAPACSRNAGSGSGDDAGAPVDAGPADAAPDARFNLTVDWEPCAFYSGGGGGSASCATVEVPADWNDPDGPRIDLFVKRTGDPAIRGQQLWTLMGGPGGSGANYEAFAATLLGADPSLDIYLLDHRGTGRSSRLGCSAEDDTSRGGFAIEMTEWPACLAELASAWGETLDQFTTTNAARDLGELIAVTRAPGQAVHVHGGSYGTYWAQRYLQLFPAQPSAVSMLGVVRPTFNFGEYDRQYTDVGSAYLAACGADAFCSSKLGPDPEAVAQQVMDDLVGYCPPAVSAGLDRGALRYLFGANMLWAWNERVLMPAVIYRLQRCDAGDVAALQFLAANLPDPLAGLRSDRLFSRVLGNHIIYSELLDPPVPTVAEAQALIDTSLFAIGSTARLIELAPLWPAYPEDQYANIFAQTDLPILMINGEYDPASPLAQALTVGANFSGPNQHFVAVPGAAHSWTSPTTDGWDCSLNIFFNFLVDPYAPLLDCLGLVLPLDFTGTPEVAAMLGVTDLWENTP